MVIMNRLQLLVRRGYCTAEKRGLILGVYQNNKQQTLTSTARKFDEQNKGKISQLISYFGNSLKAGDSRVLFDTQNKYGAVAIVGLGDENISDTEGKDEKKEAIRTAVGAGAVSLHDVGCDVVEVDDCGDVTSAAEGALLSVFTCDHLKNPNTQRKPLNFLPFSEQLKSNWEKGVKYANGQNLARRLMDSPANYLTPTLLAKEAVEQLEPLGVDVQIRDEHWIRDQGMTAYLSVAKGSIMPPAFIHATYKPKGTEDQKPLCLVGKGVTFDSGGISLKIPSGMSMMRADMGGSAVIIGALHTIAALQLPIHVQVFVPACENMPGHDPNRPGDVVYAMNGKSIEVVDTDYEGRLTLADALCYAQKVTQPRCLLSIATLTIEVIYGLGTSASAAYTCSDKVWKQLEQAGHDTGDRVWRMPLWNQFTREISGTSQADLINYGPHTIFGAQMAGSCTAAAFLKEFVEVPEYVHLDNAGMLINNGAIPYLPHGMTGRPTRTIARMAELMV